jgi:hypothetical protein
MYGLSEFNAFNFEVSVSRSDSNGLQKSLTTSYSEFSALENRLQQLQKDSARLQCLHFIATYVASQLSTHRSNFQPRRSRAALAATSTIAPLTVSVATTTTTTTTTTHIQLFKFSTVIYFDLHLHFADRSGRAV